MNLPPVPGGSVPPPPPPPAAPLPPPPPVRARGLTRNARLGLAAAGLAVAALAVFAGLRARPSEQRIRDFIVDAYAREEIDVRSAFIRERSSGDRTETITVSVDGSRPGGKGYVEVAERALAGSSPPLYGVGVRGGVATPFVSPGNANEPALDLVTLARLRGTLGHADGARLAELAGVTAELRELGALTVVRENTIHSQTVHRTAVIKAERGRFRWRLSLVEGTDDPLQRGDTSRLRPLSAFPGKVYVINRPEDREALTALGARLPALQQKLDQAVPKLMAEKRASLLATLKPGALFAGLEKAPPPDRKTPARVFLEITEVRDDEDPVRLSALLRNDGSWKETRLFSGAVSYDSRDSRLLIRLTARVELGDRGAGPFLDQSSAGFESLNTRGEHEIGLVLALEKDALVWLMNGIRFEAVASERKPALIAEIERDYPKLLEATKAGALYSGTITNKATGARENWLLQFTQQTTTRRDDDDKHGAAINAVLEHPQRASWKCALTGELEPNHYRAKGAPIRLERDHTESADLPREVTDIFDTKNDVANEDDPDIGLRLDGGRLLGENPRFVFRFEPAPADLLAERQRRTADRAARIAALLTPGAIHEGTVKHPEEPAAAPLWLRIAKVDAASANAPRAGVSAPRGLPRATQRRANADAPEQVEAILQSPARPRFGVKLNGTVDREKGQLVLRFSGPTDASFQNDPELREHFRGANDHGPELVLALAGDTAGGTLRHAQRGPAFQFKVSTPEHVSALQQGDAARQARFAAFAQAGALHEGVLERGNVSVPVLLRITRGERRGEAVDAVLHLARQPRYATRLSGATSQGVLSLRASGANDSIATPLAQHPDLEAVLSETSSPSYSLALDGADIVGASGGGARNNAPVTLRFPPMTAQRAAALQAADKDAQDRWAALMQPGVTHDGTVQRGASSPAPVRLRITRVRDGFDGLEGVLHSPERPRYAMRVVGEQSPLWRGVRLRVIGTADGALPLQDDPQFGDRLRDAIMSGTEWVLHLEHDALSGRSRVGGRVEASTLRFQPSSPERLAQLKQETAQREKRWQEIVRAGASFDGKILRETGAAAALRLKIISAVGEAVEAVLESAEKPDTGWKLGGTFRPADALLRLTTRGANHPGTSPMTDPALRNLNPYGEELFFELEPNALVGSARAGRGTKLEFPLKP